MGRLRKDFVGDLRPLKDCRIDWVREGTHTRSYYRATHKPTRTTVLQSGPDSYGDMGRTRLLLKLRQAVESKELKRQSRLPAQEQS
jgi:hypothetical protein